MVYSKHTLGVEGNCLRRCCRTCLEISRNPSWQRSSWWWARWTTMISSWVRGEPSTLGSCTRSTSSSACVCPSYSSTFWWVLVYRVVRAPYLNPGGLSSFGLVVQKGLRVGWGWDKVGGSAWLYFRCSLWIRNGSSKPKEPPQASLKQAVSLWIISPTEANVIEQLYSSPIERTPLRKLDKLLMVAVWIM